ncbi:MAG: glycosyl transferase, partial [Anaerolineae bacterium]|nr:glycosyl transferase [Anaerolineae bacterium]
GDPALNRIVKYIPQMPDSDFKGTTLYLRVKQGDGSYRVFSPYFVPTLDPYDRYECRVGMGYTRIVSEFYGIRTEATIFVPQGDTRLIRDIQITNLSDQPVELDAIPVVEYTHFDALKQFNNADWVPQTMQSELYRDGDYTILAQYAFMRRKTHNNFFTSNWPVASFETDRQKFLGDNGYGTWANPLSLHAPELSNYEARRGDNIGALLHHLGVFQPGETKRLITQLGQEASIEKALPGIRKFRDEAAANAAFAALQDFWTDYLDTIQVETPDASMNSMLNVFNPRQCHTTKNWSRYLSLYQLGLGARGIGFRDTSQDTIAILAHSPEDGKKLIAMLLSVQMRNGAAMHQFNPLTMVANMGEAPLDPERPQYYSDDHLWIVLAVCAYLRETGDMAFLDAVIPYYEKDKHEQPLESGSVRDHLDRAIEFTRHDTGRHGLPLAGYADWNDTVNLPTGAESLFTANLYGWALRDLIALAEFEGDPAAAEKYSRYHADMKATVNEQGWDGQWYRRYYDHEGQPLGSHTNTYGQIYTNAQSWAVLSGFATPERAQMALDAVYNKLNTSNGIPVSTPGYNGYDPVVGGVSTYPPGAKENGGIFLHTNPWVMIAETKLGRGDRAFQYYNQINPAAKNDAIDVYEIEPYAYCQNILSPEHPQSGLGRNSWLSGTSSWAYTAGTQYILGVQPTYRGLLIDPCIPAAWDGFRMIRRFRGATYHITVSNPGGVSKGIASLTVDGQPVAGHTVPIFDDGADHTVEVVMG